MRRGDLGPVAPLASVIEQRVGCTEAKLIWRSDDKRRTFIPPARRRDVCRTGRQRRGDNNLGYTYVSTNRKKPRNVPTTPHRRLRRISCFPSLTNIRVYGSSQQQSGTNHIQEAVVGSFYEPQDGGRWSACPRGLLLTSPVPPPGARAHTHRHRTTAVCSC